MRLLNPSKKLQLSLQPWFAVLKWIYLKLLALAFIFETHTSDLCKMIDLRMIESYLEDLEVFLRKTVAPVEPNILDVINGTNQVFLKRFYGKKNIFPTKKKFIIKNYDLEKNIIFGTRKYFHRSKPKEKLWKLIII